LKKLFDYFLRPDWGFEDWRNIRDYLVDRELFTIPRYFEICNLYEQEKLKNITPYPGVTEIVLELRRKGIPLGLVTDADMYHAKRRLEKAGLSGAFDHIDDIRSITREEALEILAEADRDGLVHSTNNARDEVTYICNCCICSCGVLRGIVEYGSKTSIACSDFYATVDELSCSGCEACIDRCQFNAISMNDSVSVVNTLNCYGCGLCITTCPEEAITLKLKSPEELVPPPATEKEWRKIKEMERQKVNLSPHNY